MTRRLYLHGIVASCGVCTTSPSPIRGIFLPVPGCRVHFRPVAPNPVPLLWLLGLALQIVGFSVPAKKLTINTLHSIQIK